MQSLRTLDGALDTDGPLDLVAAQAAGFDVVGLYLDGNLSPRVAQQATSLGMGLISFWEGLASNPNGGASQGNLDAAAATDLALAIRQPLGTAIYLPNDQIVTDWMATLSYFDAATQRVKGRGYVPAFYGQASVWLAVKPFGYAYFCKASDGTNDTAGANIVQGTGPQQQIAGITCDTDTILTPGDFGGWNYDGRYPAVTPPPPPPPPPPPSVTEESEMMFLFTAAGSKAQYLWTGYKAIPLEVETDWAQFVMKMKLPELAVSQDLFARLLAP